jgi:ribosomal protein S27E
MRINCVSCGHEINLNQDLFNDYEGPIKCFICSTMMEITTTQGVINSINLLNILTRPPVDDTVERIY